MREPDWSHPFTVVEARGHLSRGELDGPRFRRLLHGVHVAADVEVDHGVMILAARKACGDGVVLVGPTAAWAWGSRLAGPADAVLVAAGQAHDVRREPGLVRCRAAIPDRDRCGGALGPVTTPARTAVDLARGVGTSTLPFVRRVAVVDALLHATRLPAAEARASLVLASGARGVVGARQVLAVARNGAESPRETELRLLVVAAGFREPATQVVVRDGRGRFVGRLDLAWEDVRIGLEYDGAHHRDRHQHALDMGRRNDLTGCGWTVLNVGIDVLRRPRALLAQLATLGIPRS